MEKSTDNTSLLDTLDRLDGFLAGRRVHLDPNAGTEEYLQVERLSQMMHKVRGGLSVSDEANSPVVLNRILSESTVLSPHILSEGTKFQRGRISEDTVVLSRALKETKVPDTLFAEIADYATQTGLDPEAAQIANALHEDLKGRRDFITKALGGTPVSPESADTHLALAPVTPHL